MVINRYISLVFMLITVLSAHPDGIDNLRKISDLDLYKNIVRAGFELSNSKQFFKNSESMTDIAKFVQNRTEHQGFFDAALDSSSVDKELFEIYSIRLEHENIISIDRNGVWRHAVF